MSTLLQLGLVLLFICGSAFFSAAEMALSAANRLRLENAAEDGDERAKTACKVLDRFEDTLSAILIGNNLCNIGSDTLATLLTVELLGERFTPLSTLLMVLIVITFCESAPKIIAKKNANRLTLALAGFLNLLTLLLKPVVWLVCTLIHLLTAPFKGERHSTYEEEAAAELQSIIETVEDEGVIDGERGEMLRSALDFSEIPVMDVMTARVDVVALDIEDSFEEILEQVGDSSVSRLPVFEGSIDNVVGILYLNHFFKALLETERPDLRSLLLKPCYFYKTVKLPEALACFRREQQQMGIVTDEYGGTLGIVTLEDVMEQIVGEIWDENDEFEPEVVRLENGALELDGDMSLMDLPELLELSETAFHGSDSATVGGWTIENFGRFPHTGDSFLWRTWRITVLTMSEDGRRVEKILLETADEESEK
ncbi:MAG: HlyC/CorC family transporter [Clostridiales bacterium]|nr:HlyC/CorC family transporter [Candidatus Apopatocola equi]